MKYVKLIFYIFTFFLLSNYISAFLISPPKYEVDFESNAQIKLIITLINKPREDKELDTYIKYEFLHPIAKEELKNAFSLNSSKVSFTNQEDYIYFELLINFPENLSLVGTHDLRVGAVEAANEGQVAFRAGNEVRILIKNGNDTIITPPIINDGGGNNRPADQTQNIPRPLPTTRALNIDVLNITAKDVYKDEKSDIVIQVRNNENFNVYVTGIINILKENMVKEVITIPSTSLESLKTTNLKTLWDTKSADIGEYIVGATINYQGDSKNIATTMKIKEKNFLVVFSFRNMLLLLLILALIALIIITILFLLNKKKGIEILSVETKNILPNSIAEIIIRYKNHDNKYYKVYVDIIVIGINNNVVDKIGTDEEVVSKAEGSFEYNWETNNLIPGIYKIQTIIHYDNKKSEKIIEIKLWEKQL